MSDFSGWKYYLLTEQKKVSALVILVLILCFYSASYFLKNNTLIIFFPFVLLYFRDVLFPFRYKVDKENKRLIVYNFPFTRDYDLSAYIKIAKWKNGLFLSTMEKKGRTVKLFVKENDIDEVEKMLHECMSA